jgi:hypothetical protein
VRVELPELVRQDVGVGCKVEVVLAELLLHPNQITAQPVLPRDLLALRKVVDLLVLVQSLVNVRFARTSRPQQVPFVAFSVRKPICLAHRADHSVVAPQHFVKQLRILNVVGALPVVHPRWIRLQQLRLFQQLELDVVVEIFASYCVRGVGSGRGGEEVLRGLCASYAYSL